MTFYIRELATGSRQWDGFGVVDECARVMSTIDVTVCRGERRVVALSRYQRHAQIALARLRILGLFDSLSLLLRAPCTRLGFSMGPLLVSG